MDSTLYDAPKRQNPQIGEKFVQEADLNYSLFTAVKEQDFQTAQELIVKGANPTTIFPMFFTSGATSKITPQAIQFLYDNGGSLRRPPTAKDAPGEIPILSGFERSESFPILDIVRKHEPDVGKYLAEQSLKYAASKYTIGSAHFKETEKFIKNLVTQYGANPTIGVKESALYGNDEAYKLMISLGGDTPPYSPQTPPQEHTPARPVDIKEKLALLSKVSGRPWRNLPGHYVYMEAGSTENAVKLSNILSYEGIKGVFGGAATENPQRPITAIPENMFEKMDNKEITRYGRAIAKTLSPLTPPQPF